MSSVRGRKLRGKPTPSELENINRAAIRQVARARRRYAITRAIIDLDCSYREKAAFVARAVASGLLPPGDLPSPETLRQWERRWRAGARAIGDWLDHPRSGRPRGRLCREAERRIQEAIADGKTSAHRVFRELRAEGHALSYRQVHRRFAEAIRDLRI